MKISWDDYYRKVVNLQHRTVTVDAVNLVPKKERVVAIDCGCGAGRDVAYLEKIGFSVYAFDIEDNALEICKARFHESPSVKISKSSFADFDYPEANLVIANSSLYFCPEKEFQFAWHKISESLLTGGVFCGDFLGHLDSWANKTEFKVTSFTKDQALSLLSKFDIINFHVRKEVGTTALGIDKYWHTFSVIAVKNG